MRKENRKPVAGVDTRIFLAVMLFLIYQLSLLAQEKNNPKKKENAGAEGKKNHCRMMEKSAERHLLPCPHYARGYV